MPDSAQVVGGPAGGATIQVQVLAGTGGQCVTWWLTVMGEKVPRGPGETRCWGTGRNTWRIGCIRCRGLLRYLGVRRGP